jgi:peptidoglycan/xylan/chitin deacetylase (PgdA/CDA1 family)
VASPIVSVSIDLDAVACYYQIHALGAPPADGSRFAILRRALPRFVALFDEFGIRSTLFTVAKDLEEDPEGRALIANLSRSGHEIASHSYSHPYNLVRLPRAEMTGEIDQAHAVLSEVCGRAPVGFRAPGYEISGPLIDHLCQRGYRYDSSTFPAVPYYLAKAAVMAAIRATGRASGSILGSPRVLLAPRRAYHPAAGAPYAKGDLPIVELPVTVTPGLRLPVIGTSLILAPAWLRRRLVASALSTPHFNLELHGIDLADADTDGLPAALVGKQPDLRKPLSAKLAALRETFAQARDAGATFQTLETVAASV